MIGGRPLEVVMEFSEALWCPNCGPEYVLSWSRVQTDLRSGFPLAEEDWFERKRCGRCKFEIWNGEGVVSSGVFT